MMEIVHLILSGMRAVGFGIRIFVGVAAERQRAVWK
jgi:hypothetical protein